MDGFWKVVLWRASATRKSRQRYNSQPFYLVLIVVVLLATVSIVARSSAGTGPYTGTFSLRRRSVLQDQELVGSLEDDHEVRLYSLYVG